MYVKNHTAITTHIGEAIEILETVYNAREERNYDEHNKQTPRDEENVKAAIKLLRAAFKKF